MNQYTGGTASETKIQIDVWSLVKQIEITASIFSGLKIMRKYIKSADVIAAEHDIIYSCGIRELIDARISEQDVMSLRCFGWMIDEECLAHFA